MSPILPVIEAATLYEALRKLYCQLANCQESDEIIDFAKTVHGVMRNRKEALTLSCDRHNTMVFLTFNALELPPIEAKWLPSPPLRLLFTIRPKLIKHKKQVIWRQP